MALTRKKKPHSTSFSGRKKSSLKKSSPKKRQTKKEDEKAEKETSAGGVVFKVEKGKVFFAMMKDSYEKWTFPKGHVEKGEEVEEAAARETLEELGLEEIMFLEDLGKISIWFRDRFQKKGKLINKDIHYYLFKTKQGAKLFPDPTQHAMDAKWVGMNQVLKKSDYSDLKTVISNAIDIIKAYESNNSKRKSSKKK